MPLVLDKIRLDGKLVGGTHTDRNFWDVFLKFMKDNEQDLTKLRAKSKYNILKNFSDRKCCFSEGKNYHILFPRDTSLPEMLSPTEIMPDAQVVEDKLVLKR